MHRPLRTTLPAALCLICGAMLQSIAAAAVYRCTSAQAPPHFSQFPCGNGEIVVLDPPAIVSIPPISEAEQRRLDALEQERRAHDEQRRRSRARAARQADVDRRERQQRCEAVRSARDALTRQRRKGYSLSEARALDRRDAELEAEEERYDC